MRLVFDISSLDGFHLVSQGNITWAPIVSSTSAEFVALISLPEAHRREKGRLLSFARI